MIRMIIIFLEVYYFNIKNVNVKNSSWVIFYEVNFLGYDGEEVKHGYKNMPNNLKISSLRRSKRDAIQSGEIHSALPSLTFSLDQVSSSLRFDGNFYFFVFL